MGGVGYAAYKAYEHAKNVVRGRYPEGEDVISQSAHYSYFYARNVLKGRFPKGEPRINENETYKDSYNTFLQGL